MEIKINDNRSQSVNNADIIPDKKPKKERDFLQIEKIFLFRQKKIFKKYSLLSGIYSEKKVKYL